MKYKVGDRVRVQTGPVMTVCDVVEVIPAEVSKGGRIRRPNRYKLAFPRGGQDWRYEDTLKPVVAQ